MCVAIRAVALPIGLALARAQVLFGIPGRTHTLSAEAHNSSKYACDAIKPLMWAQRIRFRYDVLVLVDPKCKVRLGCKCPCGHCRKKGWIKNDVRLDRRLNV